MNDLARSFFARCFVTEVKGGIGSKLTWFSVRAITFVDASYQRGFLNWNRFSFRMGSMNDSTRGDSDSSLAIYREERISVHRKSAEWEYEIFARLNSWLE